MKNKQAIFIVFTVGLVIGGCLALYLSMKAVPSYVRLLRLNQQAEQELLAVKEGANGSHFLAAAYYISLIDNAKQLKDKRVYAAANFWNFSFPIESIALDLVQRTMETNPSKLEGINRAMLASSLEKTCLQSLSTIEYGNAAKLLGYGDNIEKVHELINTRRSSGGQWEE